MADDDGAPPALAPGARPGKVIAVHLSYASRARQRGVRPAAPSYFLKPTSSLAATGGEVERPAGAELLAFEGEIALVIGAPARHVAVDRAWAHVAAVTAANDLGVYDLRWADKGSNVRSKGRDGYTPLGPELIDARDVAPDALRVRTWVNGALVQEDTTGADALLFPLTQIVADLSQHLTLETGDVILTGTPAGSSVLVPGDVVEVEVDAPGSRDPRTGAPPSSGRLVTSVVQGHTPFTDVGSGPRVDDAERAQAWGSREAAGLDPEPAPFTLDAALADKLRRAPVAGLSAQLRKRGLNNVVIEGVRPVAPGQEIVGRATTLRMLPNREDLFAAHGGGHNAQKRAFDTVELGEVVVIEARGERGSATLGDVLALRARVRGAAGVVTDGGVRDVEAVAATGLPVFSGPPHPAVLGRRHVPWETGVAVACGGATVLPGDVIVADADGVVVIPPHLATEVADATLAQEDEDAWVAEQVAAGAPVEGLFPPNATWRAAYEAARRARES
ncbi:fumarylacetoacetate hydrolase family protein [Xylanimonas ulmi]|uniref:2-keto-4-pentenoate hydratase/2-oxohepta-3-ene-1,7-dioic acid hydratase in catechol pathway n=1 Tax=Xylanimonas ulmi TaxID=228973 RepID=A0A4Q7LZW6_9MICO|nr:fumarylacetoacetate hydrolase family protein [Xylanibacterium ulmi]RZS61005.1 2-keto-4-pentenoate hydratase/2-oxohepta-3-ene-1,7-dioic acid hydratase in catechol pathway [Xylanibacterium ulmi]